MSVSFCRTPLLRTLSVGIAALCITHTPVLADNPPPGAQHFDFAAAWSRPAVPFTSFSALLRKDLDETIPEEVLCSEFQCGTWIGDEHSPEDEFDLVGTLTFIDLIPFPEDLTGQSEILSVLDPELEQLGIDGEVTIEHFLLVAQLTTPTGYEKTVTGFAIRSDIQFTQPEVKGITGTSVYFAYQWENPTLAVQYTASVSTTLYYYSPRHYSTSDSAPSPNSLSAHDAHKSSSKSRHHVQAGTKPGGLLVKPNTQDCLQLYHSIADPCYIVFQNNYDSIVAEHDVKASGARAAYEEAMKHWSPFRAIAAGATAAGPGAWACAKLGGGLGCLAGGVGAVPGAAIGGVLGGIGAFFVGVTGSISEEYYQAHKNYKVQLAQFQGERDAEVCNELRKLRPCIQDAIDQYAECRDDDMHHWVPIDRDIQFPLPLCPEANPVIPSVGM